MAAQHHFPNLFAAKPTMEAEARELAPADMRLLQWAMRQQIRRNAGAPRAPQPSRVAPAPRPALARPAGPARPAPRMGARQMPAR